MPGPENGDAPRPVGGDGASGVTAIGSGVRVAKTLAQAAAARRPRFDGFEYQRWWIHRNSGEARKIDE